MYISGETPLHVQNSALLYAYHNNNNAKEIVMNWISSAPGLLLRRLITRRIFITNNTLVLRYCVS